MDLKNLRQDLSKLADKDKAKISQRFFKTGKGEYGEGDIFLGITVPRSRKIAIKYNNLELESVGKLLKSKIHEERLIALLILVHNFTNGSDPVKKEIFEFYLANTKHINNWDLVDLSADKIVGSYLLKKDRKILNQLVKSQNIWERRIAIMATYQFIKNNIFESTLTLSEVLLKDKHDLIQKAVGWMLREVGKRDLKTEEEFLKKYYKKMPRTMLRYAIEKFPFSVRIDYLKGKI